MEFSLDRYGTSSPKRCSGELTFDKRENVGWIVTSGIKSHGKGLVQKEKENIFGYKRKLIEGDRR